MKNHSCLALFFTHPYDSFEQKDMFYCYFSSLISNHWCVHQVINTWEYLKRFWCFFVTFLFFFYYLSLFKCKSGYILNRTRRTNNVRLPLRINKRGTFRICRATFQKYIIDLKIDVENKELNCYLIKKSQNSKKSDTVIVIDRRLVCNCRYVKNKNQDKFDDFVLNRN